MDRKQDERLEYPVGERVRLPFVLNVESLVGLGWQARATRGSESREGAHAHAWRAGSFGRASPRVAHFGPKLERASGQQRKQVESSQCGRTRRGNGGPFAIALSAPSRKRCRSPWQDPCETTERCDDDGAETTCHRPLGTQLRASAPPSWLNQPKSPIIPSPWGHESLHSNRPGRPLGHAWTHGCWRHTRAQAPMYGRKNARMHKCMKSLTHGHTEAWTERQTETKTQRHADARTRERPDAQRRSGPNPAPLPYADGHAETPLCQPHAPTLSLLLLLLWHGPCARTARTPMRQTWP